MHDLRALVRLARRVGRAGLVVAAGGNVSARAAGADEVVVTASGSVLEELTEQDLSVVDLDGVLRRGHPHPTSELALHLAAHRRRPGPLVAVHAHPPVATLLHALGHPIRLMTTDHAFYVGPIAACEYRASGSEELAEEAAARLDEADVVLLRHHGCLVVAPDPFAAFQRVANLEAAAEATYRALLLGDRSTVCPPAAHA